MSENQFITLYKTWTIDMLLEVIDSTNDYQPQAIEAARLEIESRQLTQEQLAQARAELNLRTQNKSEQQQKIKDFEDKVKSAGSSLIDTINPIVKGNLTIEKTIKFVSAFLGILFLYHLYQDFSMLKFMVIGGGKWDFSMVIYFLPLVLLPVASLLFWVRKKTGWALAVIYFSYSAAGAIPLLIMALNSRQSGVSVLDRLLPTPPPATYIVAFLLFAGLTWTLCKENIRVIYRVNRITMFIALGIGTGVILLMDFWVTRH